MSKELAANSNISHYRILSKLGAGGMGEVWLAEDTRLGRKVALKLLPAEFTEDSERVRRFTQEAKAASALNHPNIISVHDIGESETGRFIVMEFVAGRTLRTVIAKDNSLETLFTLGGQMAKALGAAHAAGITHRDIKPDNIMVRDDGYVKMLDFGLARLLPTTSSDPEAMTLAQQTTPGTVMGTLAYMSPEQATGQTVGSPSDVFALGIVLYELATGSHPFKSESMIGYLHAITSQTPPSMTSLKSQLPVALDDLILRMLEKDARQRPTAGEVAQALQEIEKYGSSNTLPIRIFAGKPKASSSEEGFWVAVLPFKYRGTNADIEALAEGLSEDILTGLSRFSYLRVIARGSTLRYANQTTDLRNVGKELGARYVMEGTLRHAGTRLRLAVQVVDATTGAHLWAENYEREFSPETIFELQDDLVPRIVSTVADWYGALPHSMSESVRLKPPDQLSPYEALLRSFGYFENIAPEEHALVMSGLARAVEQEPGNADCWAMLAMLIGEEHRFGFNVEPDSLGRSLKAARKAVEIAHANHFAWLALAQALFFRKEFDPFRDAAERAIALNPMDGSTVEYLGHLIAFSGNWERGCELAERARQLNPNHPSWYWSVPFLDAYRKGDYLSARPFLMKGNPQKNWLMHALLAAGDGQLGESKAAAGHLREVLTMMPDFPSIARNEFSKWYLPDLVDHLMDGLRKAGLETTANGQPSISSPSLASSETRADEGFWVAVLPFKFTGSSSEVRALAEGLSEEVVTGLSRFSYLRVIARSSTLRFTNENADVRLVAQELGARYVMEGSLRQAGTKVRLAVQLVDALTGAHLWAENYERTLEPESVFELQDDLVPRIVSTVADQYGALVHSISESLRGRSAGEYSPHEAVLRSFGYRERITEEEHAEVREILETAIEVAPNHSDCLSALSNQYWHEYAHGYNLRPDPLGRALVAAQRAVAAAPNNHIAHSSLAIVLFFQKDFRAFRPEAERALALNPMDASIVAFIGLMIAYSGDWESGLPVTERAKQLNPHHPGWYYLPFCYDAYRRRDYRGALEFALKVSMPGYFYTHAISAAAYAQLGEQDRARAALRDLHKLKPDFGALARELFGKWFDAELTEHLLEGLRKAGLTIEDGETGRPGDGASQRSLSPTRPFSDSANLPARYISSETRANEGFWVAVLPFKFTGASPELGALAEGLSEDIVTGLSRFSYLRVIARSSTLRFTNESADVRLVAQELGARYVMEGSLRQAGTKLRLAVQLVDASSGAHLWAENYERAFDPEALFELQDDLVPRIVATIADIHGVLPRSMSQLVLTREPEQLSPYEAVLRSFNYFHVVTPEELAAARSCLEMAVAKAPAYVDAWAMLSVLCVQDYGQGFNLTPDSLANGLLAARRAIEVGPSNHLSYFSLAQALFFQKEFQSFRDAAERAVSLNPMDGNSLAFMGELLTYVGDSERGLELAARAKQLNPHHPGWYWYADFFNAYHRGDYSGALSFARKANLPNHWGMHAAIAASAAQLGKSDVAANAVRDLLKLRPEFTARVRKESEKWWNPGLIEHFLEGLRKAGLEIEDEEKGREGDGEKGGRGEGAKGRRGETDTSPLHPVTPSPVLPVSTAPSIAVLPFVNRSPDPGNDYFSDGLTEEIITDLSQIEALRVISRNSSMSFKGSTRDTPSIAKELGVSHLVSGSVRRAGDDLRVTVELIEVVGDTSLWSEKYSGTVADVFAIQEEIALKIVSALKIRLTNVEKQQAKSHPIQDVVAYDCYLRARQEMYGWTPESMDRADKLVDQALGIVGENALLLATKGQIHWNKVNVLIDPDERLLDSAADCAQRALAIDENEYLAIFVRGLVAGLRGDNGTAIRDIYRAHQLRPGDPNVLVELCRFANGSGIDVDDYVKELVVMDPLTPVTWCVVAFNHQEHNRIAESVPAARRIVELSPGPSAAHIFATLALAGAGLREEAIEIAATAGEKLAGTPHGSWASFLHHALVGDRERASAAMTPVLEKGAALVDLVSYSLAVGYSLIGKNDESLKWIQTGMNRGFLNYPFLSTYDLLLANVRSDPRFPELMKVVKARWEALADSLPGTLQLQTLPDGETGRSHSSPRPVSLSPLLPVPVSPSIAVLPFVNISNDSDNEYFCDGLAEELLNALSKIEALRVAARTSAFSFKGKDIDVREVGQKLNVGAVLEGSVRRSGNRLRISAQLINIADGYQLWSEKYDRQMEDIFDIQDQISLAIVDALKVKLLGEEKAKVTKRYTDDAEVYELFLKGRYYSYKYTAEGWTRAVEFFEKVIEKQPRHAAAHAGIAAAVGCLWFFGLSPADETVPTFRSAAIKAIELDGNLAGAHLSLGMVNFFHDWEWEKAEQEFKQAILLNPKDAEALSYYALFLGFVDRFDEAMELARRALEVDPLSLLINMNVGWTYFAAGLANEAVNQARKMTEIEPGFFGAYWLKGATCLEKGEYEEAVEQLTRAVSLGAHPIVLADLGAAYALAGKKETAETILAQLLEMRRQSHVSAICLARVYSRLGELEKTIQWLETAYEERNGELVFLKNEITSAAMGDSLNSLGKDPRVMDLLEKMKLPLKEPSRDQESK